MFFRNFAAFSLLAVVAMATVPSVWAQQRSGAGLNGAQARGEQNARARWQPVRPVQGTEELPTPSPNERGAAKPQEQADRQAPRQAVPLVDLDGSSGGPRRDTHGHSVMQPRSDVYPEPLDGQIIYEGTEFSGTHGVSGGYGCDAVGGCGLGCDGGCDSLLGACGIDGCHACIGDAWRPCVTLCVPQDGWVSFEYLGWFQRGMKLPPLVTTSVGQLPARDRAGVLGGPTRVLFGGEDALESGFSGGRLQVGLWLDRCHTWAAVGEYFELGSRSESFSGNTNGYPVLARPFFNVLTGEQDSQLISYPNFATGSLNAEVTSSLVGGGFHLRRQTNSGSGCGRGLLCDGCSTFHTRTEALFGYRYVQLDESLGVSENLVGTTPGESFRINDHFRTMNQFNGFDMGMAYNRRRGCWSLDLLAKLAIGNTRQRVDINGNTSIGGAAAQTGGLLAQTTNIGSYSRDQFSVLPELGADLGYELTHNLRVKVGYTLIYWSSVVRPGDQVDLDVNPNLFPPALTGGAARPHFDFVDTNYWVQGMNFGAEFTW